MAFNLDFVSKNLAYMWVDFQILRGSLYVISAIYDMADIVKNETLDKLTGR